MSVSRQTPRLARIADSLGVSTATVSNALSGKGRVSPELAERIRATAAELGYVPSLAGRALRTGRSGVLGLVLPDIANPLFPQIAQAIENAAAKAGYGVLIADSRGQIATQTQAIERLLERGVDGLVVVPRRGTRIGQLGCPVAVIDSPSTPGNTVSADHWAGGAELGRHLLSLGHRHVLLVGNSPASTVQNDRIGGIRAGLGKVVAETIWIEALEDAGGRGCSLGLADAVARGATAVATVSDLIALRALTELHHAGLEVPRDVSVTGFDDLIWSSVITPGLTTVRMDVATIAELAVNALMTAIAAPSPAAALDTETTLADVAPGERGGPGRSRVERDAVVAAQSKVPMELVVRQSTGPASRSHKKTANLTVGELIQ
ncbi:LacI family DNA-binding transcriptional regulator [Neorhizobium sp. NPDC001467]|uniref:LacI family DNA-binding transcriptional regulator n=1 Tax=Neorhizobium sp. NPDC001467 TaxID=3390595 RepID=UPI003D067D0F